VNVRGAGKEQKPHAVPAADFIARVKTEMESRALTLGAGGVPS
jgi:hypothetical protein